MKLQYQGTVTNLPSDFQRALTPGRTTLPEGTAYIRMDAPKRYVVRKLSDLQQAGNPYSPYCRRWPDDDPAIIELVSLREEERLTDDPITTHAFTLALNLLKLLRIIFRESVPAPLIAPDSQGGVRMEWFHNDANIRVIIPREGVQIPYMYVRANGESEVKPFTPSIIARTLRALFAYA